MYLAEQGSERSNSKRPAKFCDGLHASVSHDDLLAVPGGINEDMNLRASDVAALASVKQSDFSVERAFSASNRSVLSHAGVGEIHMEQATQPAGPAAGAGMDDGPLHFDSDHSNSSGHWLRTFCEVPLRVRSRAEAWELRSMEIQVGAEVGRGTGGVVYKCKWRGLECAGKVLCNSSSESIEYHDMINEISIISHLRHPNLVLFLGACTMQEPLLILSEFMSGGSLEARYNLMRGKLGKPWQPPRQQVHRWMMDLTRAVCFLHSCSNPIMHRDLKPSNLLLSEHDHLKVSDFGLCKTLKKVKEDGSPYSMTGCTGTKRYMAPEVVLSRPDYDLKVDVYSMAMIFWYMCKGERPFEYVEPQLISVLASTRGLRPDSRAVRWGPIEHLIEQMWEEDPAKRPEATEILVTLKGVVMEPDAASTVGSWTECSLHCQCAVM